MRLYRIYTEADDVPRILATTGAYFHAFTAIQGRGVWNGIEEHSIVLEILTDDAEQVKILARILKREGQQEAVLVVSSEVDSQLI